VKGVYIIMRPGGAQFIIETNATKRNFPLWDNKGFNGPKSYNGLQRMVIKTVTTRGLQERRHCNFEIVDVTSHCNLVTHFVVT